ncbi:unnamed protein product [Phytophthora lilii]|uniref:Unnamed protein product n=1 Tax=Phytophthora lilii TaxID=2077276 RepID=A0A9W6WT55_9STRA|nr:unnamed protein product [Phytophthora lilii]
MAPQLQKKQYNQWVADGLNPTDVMKRLQLDKSLSSPYLNAVAFYVTLFNEKHATNKVSLIGILVAHYGDDQLATVIDAARRIKSTQTIATKLQFEQLAVGLDSRKTVN